MINTILVVLNVITLWLLFEKAGDKGWKSLIPYYSFYSVSKHGRCTGLFWTHLFLGIVSSIVIIVSFSIRAVSIYDSAMAAENSLDLMMAFLTPGNILLSLLSITLIMLLAAIKMRIHYLFTRCFTRDTGLLVVACIGSLTPLFFVQVIIRCILAFDEGYQYLGQGEPQAEPQTEQATEEMKSNQ